MCNVTFTYLFPEKNITAARVQGLPSDYDMQVDVDKRNANEVDFITCVRKGRLD